jgi:tetratricopeptide (TPR) repeat protein
MSFFNLFSKEKIRDSIQEEIEGEKLFYEGDKCFKIGNKEEAIKFFTKSIEASPNHSSVYLNRGASYMFQERYLEAFDDFIRAIDLENKGVSLDKESCVTGAMENISRIEKFISFEQAQGENIRNLLENDGKEHFTNRLAEELYECLNDHNETTKQFIYEEIEELKEMGGIHQEYALNCGFKYNKVSNFSNKHDTRKAFKAFKGILCCFSRDVQKMFDIRVNTLEKLNKMSEHSYKIEAESNNQKINFNSRLHLSEVGVDIMFIVKNGSIMYINQYADQLYEQNKDGYMYLNGRVVNFIFETDNNNTVEIFVAFDEAETTMFHGAIGADMSKLISSRVSLRCNMVTDAIMKFFIANGIKNVFAPTEKWSTQYLYTFKLCKKKEKYFMINNAHSQAYLISDNLYKNNDVSAIKAEFWGMQSVQEEV